MELGSSYFLKLSFVPLRLAPRIIDLYVYSLKGRRSSLRDVSSLKRSGRGMIEAIWWLPMLGAPLIILGPLLESSRNLVRLEWPYCIGIELNLVLIVKGQLIAPSCSIRGSLRRIMRGSFYAPLETKSDPLFFSMNNHKAPGPDGMSVRFFKHYWESVGDDFCDAMSDFFVQGNMHKGINTTNIVLIPKGQNPKRPNNFRPISLCNVMYKVISKIVANRIKPALPSLIFPTQAAFFVGRNIQDNNVIMQEIIHSFNRKKGKEGYFAIKIDLVKAYDRLSWKCIDHNLDCFGFPQKFRHWVSQCISTTTLNICLNGGQVGKIMPSCGIMQGDPLSPYLFICAAEVLSRLLEEALGKGNIQGIRLSRGGPILSYIFFADDLILVGRANLREAQSYWSCLEKFCDWSGQKVNKLKTSIFFGKNTLEGMRRGIKDTLGINSPDGVVKYLGLPLFRSKQKDADFNFILDNLTSKMQGWKAKTLSKEGQATLIKSVGLALPIYAMQTTKLSNRLVNRIDGLIRDFWWGFEKGNHGLHLRAWDKLCLPKSLGGLGFQKTKEMNIAFLAKWGWKILNGCQSLCCKILEAKYLKGKDFLSCNYKDSDSLFWKNIVKANTIMRKWACKVVANGRDICIWRDPWIPHCKGFVPKPKDVVFMDNTRVTELLLSRGEWDLQKLNSLFDQETVSAILKGGNPSGHGLIHPREGPICARSSTIRVCLLSDSPPILLDLPHSLKERNEARFGVAEFALITKLNFVQGPSIEEKDAHLGNDRLLNLYFNKFGNVRLPRMFTS
uniref:Reverse transcriptase domain-containing protein n=1 Tax=Cannabis sativa TaxID=3483 RepID=A0A803PV05_CANSA